MEFKYIAFIVGYDCGPGRWTCPDGQCISFDQSCEKLTDSKDESEGGKIWTRITVFYKENTVLAIGVTVGSAILLLTIIACCTCRYQGLDMSGCIPNVHFY
ncbi:hypothetical protein Btru_012885 [Bulinus truncatus]|nr:hypothetical protein Btru_012885 [Bulinus truncatus]